jgi:hypothetical protein
MCWCVESGLGCSDGGGEARRSELGVGGSNGRRRSSRAHEGHTGAAFICGRVGHGSKPSLRSKPGRERGPGRCGTHARGLAGGRRGRGSARALGVDDTQWGHGFPCMCSGCVRPGEAQMPRDARANVGGPDAEAHGRHRTARTPSADNQCDVTKRTLFNCV